MRRDRPLRARRRSTLVALGLLAVLVAAAGCVGAPSADFGTADRSATTTGATTTDAATPTTRPLPEPPEELTREAVTGFVVEREEAVLYNRLVADHDRVRVGCEVRSVNRTADGFRMRVGCGTSTYDYDPEADVTAHGDGFSRAVYVVNESGAWRSEP